MDTMLYLLRMFYGVLSMVDILEWLHKTMQSYLIGSK